MSNAEYLIRACAQSVIRATDGNADLHKAVDAFLPSVRRLAERPDLLTLGVSGDAVHAASRRYLYLDDALQIILARMANGFALPVHDHGVSWELGFVYRGEIQQKLYERSDDGRQPGRAELRLVEDRIFKEGDYVFIAPPQSGVHTLIGRAEETYMLGILGAGGPPGVRRYFQPERGTYIERAAGNT